MTATQCGNGGLRKMKKETIQEILSKTKLEEITNDMAIGYMILAAKDLGLDKKVIKEIEKNMKNHLEQTSKEKVIETYNNFI